MSRAGSVVILDTCFPHLFCQLGDLTIHDLEVLDDVVVTLPTSSLRLAIISAGLVPTLETLGCEFLFLFRTEFAVLFLGVVAIFDGSYLTLTTVSLYLGNVDGGARLRLGRLADVILVKSYASVKVVAELFIRHNTSLDGIKLVGLDTVKKVTDLGTWINPSVAVFNEPFHDGMLLLVDVHVAFKVPTALLAIVDCILEFVLGKRRHVVDVVWPKEMPVEIKECHPSVP
jgi:hypothetical protein